MNSTISDTNLRIQIKYDKLNTKYNRLWEQVTNIGLFVLASVIAYSIAYLQYNVENKTVLLFLKQVIIQLVIIALPIILIFGSFLALLFTTREELKKVLNDNKIFNY